MNDSRHITKNKFYEVIQKRLYEYREAIFGNSLSQPMSLMMLQSAQYSINQLKIIDSQINLFDSVFWGYGINNISVGNESYSHLNVEQIKRIGGLNKHHEDYRIFLLLIFKVEKCALFANFFSIDSCKPNFNSNLNIKYDLKNFDNAELKLRTNNNIFIEFFFKGNDQPMSFQIETYHVGGYLTGIELAKYYVNKIKELADEAKNKENLKADVDEISELDKKIYKIERELRRLIGNTLMKETGKNDFESLLSGKAKEQIKRKLIQHVKKHPNKKYSDFKLLDRAIQFCDIEDLKKTILKPEYWQFFELRFQDKLKVEKYFDNLSELRNVIRHKRELTNLVMYEGKAAIEWLEMVIDR
jgi:hypothetical protein